MKPYQVLIFIVAVMAITGGLYWAFPEKGVEGDDLVVLETLDSLENPGDLDTLEILDIPEPPKTVAVEAIPKVIVDSTTDSRIFLRRFYASLAETATRTVRILHYGDSQIEEDRMTMQIREAFQNRYGGRGVGLMPLAQTIPSLTEKQQLHMNGHMVNPMQGPQRYFVYGLPQNQRSDKRYGVMGQMAEMNDELVKGSESIVAVCTQDEIPRYTRWKIFADSTITTSISGDTVRLHGRGNVYGLSQESETGVIVDNLAMRGCLGLVFTKMDSTQLSTFYREENVRLIIMQFGGNAIPFNEKPSTIQSIVKGLRNQIRYLRRQAPEADILFIGPSDMIRRVDGEWETYPMVPYMDKMLHKMALEENIAYFSLYGWMGGSGSMLRWKDVGLTGADGIHFYRTGAKKAGDAVAEWILEGVDN